MKIRVNLDKVVSVRLYQEIKKVLVEDDPTLFEVKVRTETFDGIKMIVIDIDNWTHFRAPVEALEFEGDD